MKNRAFVKKIISGKYKNTILEIPSKDTTRSSKAIVLESFFNTLQFEIIDAVFVELFSGSGSIGLEALSRGAKKIYFFEKDKNAINILRKNIAKTSPNDCQIIAGDTFSNINSLSKTLLQTNTQAYFYIDPPFSIRDGMEQIYENMLHLIASLPREIVKLIIIEHMSELKLEKNIGIYELLKSKKFGNTTLSYYK